jgi:hypothetical protein
MVDGVESIPGLHTVAAVKGGRVDSMNNKHIAFLLLPLLASGILSAQTCGNPAGSTGRAQWTMALSGAYQTLDHGSQTAESRRLFFKTQYGLLTGLDAYGMVGAVQLAMKSGAAGFSASTDKYRFAYGAGFSFQTPTSAVQSAPRSRIRRARKPVSLALFGGGHLIRYPSKAIYRKAGDASTQEFRLDYDCREATGYAGLLLPMKTLKCYLGGVAWGIQRLDEKKQTWLGSDGTPIWSSPSKKGKYQSGIWTGGMVGIQYDLPENYSLSVEGIAFNEQYYQVMIGISQTGIRPW